VLDGRDDGCCNGFRQWHHCSVLTTMRSRRTRRDRPLLHGRCLCHHCLFKLGLPLAELCEMYYQGSLPTGYLRQPTPLLAYGATAALAGCKSVPDHSIATSNVPFATIEEITYEAATCTWSDYPVGSVVALGVSDNVVLA
jgi:hypothetical protein